MLCGPGFGTAVSCVTVSLVDLRFNTHEHLTGHHPKRYLYQKEMSS